MRSPQRRYWHRTDWSAEVRLPCPPGFPATSEPGGGGGGGGRDGQTKEYLHNNSNNAGNHDNDDTIYYPFSLCQFLC